MGAISAGDKTLLRQPVDSQYTIETLYSMGFDVVWTGRVNDATIARGDRSIVYDGGAMSGTFTWADLQSFDAGLEVWFGSTAGGQERGRRRLRSIGAAEAAGTLVIDWNDDMSLSDDDYITIVHNYPAWPKYSWFTTTGPEFRKDGPDGILYAASGDANDTPAPHVIMGRHYAGEIGDAASLDISFDATNTVDVAGGGGAYSYAWDITPPTAASFDNAAIGAPTLTVTAEGRWWVHCTVTIDGRSTTGHRAVKVGGGITEFERGPITTKWDSTHLEVQIDSSSPDTGSSEIRPEVDWSDFEDHALVIITATDYYGSTQKSISFRDDGVYDDRQHIVFTGYLMLENNDFVDDGTGLVQMSAVSLVDMFVYSLSLTGVTAASQWYQMASSLMTVAGNLLHLFRWHSTLLDIADWWLPWSDTVKRSANEEFGEGDIMERARALCRARVMGMTVNPQGEIFVETDLNTRTAAERAAETTTLTLTDADLSGDKRVRIRRRGDVIRVLLDGGYSQGRMGTFQPYFSASQEVARAEGRPALVHLDGLMFPSQAEANRLAGRLAGIANRKYSEVNLDFSGNYREIFSPADQQWTDLGSVFAASLRSNLREFSDLDDINVVPRQVTHSHSNSNGITSVSAIFDVEAPVELTGVTITPPEVPSEDPYDGTWDFPAPPETPAIPELQFSGSLVAFDLAEGCWVRFPDASDWEERNDVRTGTDDNDYQGGWDPWWFTPAKANTSDTNSAILWACQVGKIWRSTDCGQIWLDVTPEEDPPDSWGDTPDPTVAGCTFVQRVDNIHQNGYHCFLATWQNGASEWRSWYLVTEDDGVTWTWTAPFPIIGDGTYVYAFQAKQENINYYTAPGQRERSSRTAGNLSDATGFADDSGYELTYYEAGAVSPRTKARGTLFFDFGAAIAPSKLEIRVKKTGTINNDAVYGLRATNNDAAWAAITEDGNYNDALWSLIDATAETWLTNAGGTFDWEEVYTAAMASYRYWAVEWQPNPVPPNGFDGDSFEVDAFRATATYSAPDMRLLWADVDSEDGSTLWTTMWYDDNLYLNKRNIDGLASQGEYDLGACTEAQLNAHTYDAYPYTPPFDKDTCYVFGRMNDPQSLGNPSHLIRTINGGTAFTLIEGGFGADYISAFRAEGDTTGARQFYAIRSGAGVAKFYQGNETLTYRIDTSFAAGVAVYVDALTITPDGTVAVGADTVAANMIEVIETPWASWTDITDSFTGTNVSSLTYL